MFKLNDKKHRKRALMKLQCAPKCTTEDEKDGADFYNVASSSSTTTSNGHQVTRKTMEYAVKYNLDDSPSLTRKSMKFEESSFDQVDNAGSSRVSKTYVVDERNSSLKSKVLRVRASASIALKSPFIKIAELDQGHKRHYITIFIDLFKCMYAGSPRAECL